MKQEAIIHTLAAILEKKGPLGHSIEELASYRYLDTGHIDSFALMGFIIELEDQFNIELSPEDTQSDEFRTVGGVATLIERKHA